MIKGQKIVIVHSYGHNNDSSKVAAESTSVNQVNSLLSEGYVVDSVTPLRAESSYWSSAVVVLRYTGGTGYVR